MATINPLRMGGASHEHTRSAREGAITLCAAAALARRGLAHGCRMRVARAPAAAAVAADMAAAAASTTARRRRRRRRRCPLLMLLLL